MYLITALVVGLLIGLVGGYLLQENFDLMVLNICMGIVGAVSGAAIYYFAVGDEWSVITLAGILSQAVGALFFVLIFSLIHKASSRKDSFDVQE